ncbi:hypothetical protein ABB55_21710 [Prosthecomicrobium hirschii]|uniref:DUF3168 domain-containing protein n=1 Tax=Prosthecodimorpha hirschii TaxID=665126 RepID=A0A0P6W7G1_9HYPH|nr:DUF3168 domain-containing protein [Prosthecomicrobium hirschii]KPL54514.1 hypothetical protein ABB55_21710 [Prosthecomicrobium hirschii]
MSHDAGSQLLAALRARLVADAALEALLGGPGRIHDGPPRDAALPYLAIDTVAGRPIGGVGLDLVEHEIVVSAWSRAGGKREALALADRVDLSLAETPPAPAGHRLVSLRLDRRDARLARDRVTAIATLTFRAVTEAP